MRNKKFDHRDKSAVLWWDTDYDGAAIYALVDDEGKMYIGQTTQLQKRLRTHLKALTKVRNGSPGGARGEGQRIVEAVAKGKNFEAKILRLFPEDEITVNVLRYWECHYYELYGERDHPWELAKNLYNSTFPIEPLWEHAPMNVPIKTVT